MSIPHIALINRSTVSIDMPVLADVLHRQVHWHFQPVWNKHCTVSVEQDFLQEAWALVIVDDADAVHALGYTNSTRYGKPLIRVYAKSVIQASKTVSAAASHELLENLIDPKGLYLVAYDSSNKRWAYEICDPVEDETYEISGVKVSNFVFPDFYRHSSKAKQFDHMKTRTKPFQLSTGGFAAVEEPGSVGWMTVFGSREKELQYRKEDRREYRVEERIATLRRVKDVMRDAPRGNHRWGRA